MKESIPVADTPMDSKAPTPVRVGLIGAGGIGSFHAESLARRVADAELAAVADPAEETAERVASSLGGAYATPDPADVMEDSSIEAVLIAPPPALHAALIDTAPGG